MIFQLKWTICTTYRLLTLSHTRRPNNRNWTRSTSNPFHQFSLLQRKRKSKDKGLPGKRTQGPNTTNRKKHVKDLMYDSNNSRKMGVFDPFWIKGAKNFAPLYPRDERRLHQWWWYPRSPWMGLQQLCKALHKQRTHTASKDESQRRGKKGSNSMSHTPHTTCHFSPAGLEYAMNLRYLESTLPPPFLPDTTPLLSTIQTKPRIKKLSPPKGM